MSMSREETTSLARRICDTSTSALPADVHLVVVVTDAAGDWVGVAASIPVDRTEAILNSALRGIDRKYHGHRKGGD